MAAGGIIRGFGRGLTAVAVAIGLTLLAMALYFQLTGHLLLLTLAGTALAAVLLALCWWRRMAGPFWALALAVAAAGGIWYSSITPSNDLDWTPDVEHGVTGVIEGDTVTLYNVRNFDWQAVHVFTGGWETRSYQLSQITSVDLISSVWANPAIAHTLMSFGFADGRHVVFSAEIRKTKGGAFSTLGGFFRMFDLVLIAADERDILRLRTDIRGESVSLYSLNAPPALMQRLFVNYVTLGNELAVEPRFYNTGTTNCTTVIWQLAREIDPALRFDYRILLSGWIAGYLQRIGLLPQDVPLAQLEAAAHVPPVGPAGDDSVEFSRRLRAGMAGQAMAD